MISKELPITIGAQLLDINRTSIYYQGLPSSDFELECKALIDQFHTEHPTWGARQLAKQLQNRGYHIGRKKTRRFMTDVA